MNLRLFATAMPLDSFLCDALATANGILLLKQATSKFFITHGLAANPANPKLLQPIVIQAVDFPNGIILDFDLEGVSLMVDDDGVDIADCNGVFHVRACTVYYQ